MTELAAPEWRESERTEPVRGGGAANSRPPMAPAGTRVLAKDQRRKFAAESKLRSGGPLPGPMMLISEKLSTFTIWGVTYG